MEGRIKAIKSPNELAEILFKGIDEQILILSKDYKILWANKKFLDDLGVKLNELIGKDCYSVTQCRNRHCEAPYETCPLIESLRTHKPATSTHIHFDKEGNQHYFEITVYPIKDEKAEIIQFVHMARDVTLRVSEEQLKEGMWTEMIKSMEGMYADLANSQTELEKYRDHLEELVEERTKELKESQAKLIQSEKLAAVSQIAAEAAHEVKNPLAVIKAGAYYLKKIIPKEEEAQKTIYQLNDAVGRAISYINNLLSFSRPSVLNLVPVDINEVIDASLNELPPCVLADIEIKKDFETRLPQIMADLERLKQVFTNIIKNAEESMEGVESRELRIETKEEEGFVRISISDTGKGIREENLEHIFDPFFTTKGKGTGLGLAICKRIIEAHNGKIEVVSELGKGTTFIVRMKV